MSSGNRTGRSDLDVGLSDALVLLGEELEDEVAKVELDKMPPLTMDDVYDLMAKRGRDKRLAEDRTKFGEIK